MRCVARLPCSEEEGGGASEDEEEDMDDRGELVRGWGARRASAPSCSDARPCPDRCLGPPAARNTLKTALDLHCAQPSSPPTSPVA
jgi:hypothetical protein